MKLLNDNSYEKRWHWIFHMLRQGNWAMMYYFGKAYGLTYAKYDGDNANTADFRAGYGTSQRPGPNGVFLNNGFIHPATLTWL